MVEVQTNDVLCGRGGGTNKHEGNREFRKIVADHQPAYLATERKKDKRIIAESIVNIVRSKGGRFLIRKSEKDPWEQVQDERAREKASQALREGQKMRRRSKSSTPNKKQKTEDVSKEQTSTKNTQIESHHERISQPSLISQTQDQEMTTPVNQASNKAMEPQPTTETNSTIETHPETTSIAENEAGPNTLSDPFSSAKNQDGASPKKEKESLNGFTPESQTQTLSESEIKSASLSLDKSLRKEEILESSKPITESHPVPKLEAPTETELTSKTPIDTEILEIDSQAQSKLETQEEKKDSVEVKNDDVTSKKT